MKNGFTKIVNIAVFDILALNLKKSMKKSDQFIFYDFRQRKVNHDR